MPWWAWLATIACPLGGLTAILLMRWEERTRRRVRRPDPLDDPAVQAMLTTVLLTGRPMRMNAGERPEFVDEQASSKEKHT